MATMSIQFASTTPTNATQIFCKEKPVKLLPQLANAPSVPSSKQPCLSPLPLANAASLPPHKPLCKLQQHATYEANAIKKPKPCLLTQGVQT